MLCAGALQAVLLRSEPHVQLFRPHSDAHLTRALHGHQAPDVEPSFRDAGGSRIRDRRRVAPERRLLAAVAGRLRHRQDQP